MTFLRLLLRNLRFHWRGNLAVALGAAVGTAVLTGALLVGDSMRGTLEELTLRRLGWVEHALVRGKFFREDAGKSLSVIGPAERWPAAPPRRVVPAVLLRGTASAAGGRVNQVILYGVTGSFWDEPPPVSPGYWTAEPETLEARSVVLSAPLARDLNLKEGDKVTFSFEKAASAPRESLLGKRQGKDVLAALTVRVAVILPDDHLGSVFSLSPAPSAPRNAFFPLVVLQDELRGQFRRASSLPEKPVNALFVSAVYGVWLDERLGRALNLSDWGLVLRERRKPARYVSLESRQGFLDREIEGAVKGRVGANLGARTAPTLVYMAINVATVQQHALAAAAATAPPNVLPIPQALAAYYGPVQVPYSVVAALDPAQEPPLGPFLPPGVKELKDNEILLVDWDGSPLTGTPRGAPVALTYFETGEQGRLDERTVILRAAGSAPLQGALRDRNLTPEFPGVTDARTMADWKDEAPFPFDESRLHQRDHDFWAANKATPKAYVTLKTGRKLWGGRYGDLTSIRIAPPENVTPAQVEEAILKGLDPAHGGFAFQDVRSDRLEASQGGLDFGMLFLGFSAFLILAALLLVGLLFRLNVNRRAAEVGLLLAVGVRARAVRRLLVAEGAAVAALGGLLGLVGAIGYTAVVLRALGANWPSGLGENFFGLHVTPMSLGIGYFASLAVSIATIAWATRGLAKVSPRALLLGETEESPAAGAKPLRWSKWVAAIAAVGGVGWLVAGTQVTGHEWQAGSFFGGGALLLTAGLAVVWMFLKRAGTAEHAAALPSLGRLAIRNAARNPVRSLLTAGLLASASFMVVAVQAFHRDPGRDFLAPEGGSGGFALLAESEIPVFEDIKTPQGATVVPLRVRAGDDASCLNLFQPTKPRLLGVPPSQVRRGGFQFAATEAQTAEQRANPWLLLEQKRDDGAIPVFGEANTVTWMLKSGLGRELTAPDGSGKDVRLRVVGLLKDSAFQGELLMSEGAFLTLYPRQEGYQMFLIDPGPAGAAEVRRMLETSLADYGLTVSESARRLEVFLAVVNTYLATFQALGQLGLLLGVLGLAVVLLRGVWERRSELALLRALGLRNAKLGRLIFAENAFLLAAGLGVGLAAALLSVAPHLLGGAGEALLPRLLGFLLIVAAVGLAAGALAVWSTLKAPLLPALRRE